MGAILAGGKSRRMGTHKALLKIDGIPMIQRIASTLQEVFEDVRIVADDAELYAFLGLPTISDRRKDAGPLGGIHAALHAAPAPRVFVIGCDMPFVTSQLIRFVLDSDEQCRLTAVSDGTYVQPLCGLYEKSLLPDVEERLLSGDFRLLNFVLAQHPAILLVSPSLPWYRNNLLSNINDPPTYQSLFAQKQDSTESFS